MSRVKTFEFLAGFDVGWNQLAMAINRVLCGNNCVVNDGMSLDDCVGYMKLRDALQVYFKYDDFRPGQLEDVVPVVHGKDVFVCLPTGGGKSLCIFLALLAISDRAIAIVVSLLVAKSDGSAGEC